MSVGSRSAEVITLSRHRGGGDYNNQGYSYRGTTDYDHQDNRIADGMEEHYGSNVGRLKSLFQQRMQSDDNYVRPGFTSRTNARQNDNKNISPVTSPPYRAGASVPDVRSPESKRKYTSDDRRDAVPSKTQRDVSGRDHADGDSQQFLESANHVQRFQYSRMMFARMADKNKEHKTPVHINVGGVTGRRVSPNKGMLSPLSPSSPTTSSSSPISPGQRILSPPDELKQRSVSDPSEMENFASHQSRQRGYHGGYHHASDQRLDHWGHENAALDHGRAAPPFRPTVTAENPTPSRYIDKNVARSRSDVGLPNHSDAVEEISTAPLKTRLQQFENKSRQMSGGQREVTISSSSRPNRFIRDENRKNQEMQEAAPSLPPRNYHHSGGSIDHNAAVSMDNVQSTYNISSQHTANNSSSSAWEEPGVSHATPATRPDTLATKTNRYSYSDYSRNSEPDNDPPPYRVNRYSQEDLQQQTASKSSNAAGNTGVLLRRRRREDERRLSKEEIKASLDAADAYWQKWQKESEINVDKMTDSNISSGSGEETAKSDLEKEDIEQTSLDPEVQRRSWAEKPRAQRRSRSSDYMEDRAHAVQRSMEREALQEVTKRYSGDFSHLRDIKVEETTVVTAHKVNTINSSAESLASTATSTSSQRPPSVQEVNLSEQAPVINSRSSAERPASVHQENSVDSNKQLDYAEAELVVQTKTQRPASLVAEDNKRQSQELANHVDLGMEVEMESSDDVEVMLDDLMAKTEVEEFINSEDTSREAQLKRLLIEREQGDGTEQPEPDTLPPGDGIEVDEGIHMLDDGNFFFEIDGLPDTDASDGDYPTAKPPSRIKFSSSPIRVYSTFSVEEYDRRNEDVDPMAASAEYELEKRVERMDVFPVELEKGPEGLGLSIIGMGVGADAGLEKLGIFIKTLTPGGAAERDGRISVNDQIIEVDGKSLVGVTQAYAASVLRNTSGKVSFLIGREKNPQMSEVARLIQQSLEQDKRRNEIRKREQEERQKEQEEYTRQQETRTGYEKEEQPEAKHLEADTPDVISPVEEEAAVDVDDILSPEEPPVTVEGVYDLDGSSSEGVTPDMDPQLLFIKLKEAQYKNAVSEAELAKLKAKMILLENAEVQRRHYEKKYEEMSQRLRETEKMLSQMQKTLSEYQDMLEGSQGQYIALEKKLNSECQALDKKYHKAKKLIKDYQQREKDFMQERESMLQQQTEKDQQYNSLVKSLKDRIFQLEKDLSEAQKAAGLPTIMPKEPEVEPAKTSQVQSAAAPPLPAALPPDLIADNLSELSDSEFENEVVTSPEMDADSPVKSPVSSQITSSQQQQQQQPTSLIKTLAQEAANQRLSDTTSSTTSLQEEPQVAAVAAEIVTEQVVTEVKTERPVSQHSPSDVFDKAVPDTELLDTSANRSKAQLANVGALASRRPPTKKGVTSISSDDADTDTDQEPFVAHDGENTVRKNNNYRKKRVTEEDPDSPPDHPPPPPPYNSLALADGTSNSAKFTPTALPPQLLEELHEKLDRDSQSDTSSISQYSYDPSRPSFHGKDAEISSNDKTETTDSSSSVQLLKVKMHNTTPPPSSKSASSSGGVVLLSKKRLDPFGSGSSITSEGGIQLLSSRPIDTGYNPTHSRESSSTVSEYSTSGAMISDMVDDSSKSMSYDIGSATLSSDGNQYQSSSVSDWTTLQVAHWLRALELEQYAEKFMSNKIDGAQLLQIDSNRLKALGIVNGNDRNTIKKKVKELKNAIEKERKQQEKEQKARDKLEKQAGKKKKFTFSKS